MTYPPTTDFTPDELDRLTSGTLVTDDTPAAYTNSTPADSYAELITVTSRGVTLATPPETDTTFTIHPETVPERGTPVIDFFHDRPQLFLYSPLIEEPVYVFALPTRNDPYTRLVTDPTTDASQGTPQHR